MCCLSARGHQDYMLTTSEARISTCPPWRCRREKPGLVRLRYVIPAGMLSYSKNRIHVIFLIYITGCFSYIWAVCSIYILLCQNANLCLLSSFADKVICYELYKSLFLFSISWYGVSTLLIINIRNKSKARSRLYACKQEITARFPLLGTSQHYGISLQLRFWKRSRDLFSAFSGLLCPHTWPKGNHNSVYLD